MSLSKLESLFLRVEEVNLETAAAADADADADDELALAFTTAAAAAATSPILPLESTDHTSIISSSLYTFLIISNSQIVDLSISSLSIAIDPWTIEIEIEIEDMFIDYR